QGRRRGVIDLDHLSARVHPVAQVTGKEFGWWHCVRCWGRPDAIAKTFVGKEEETPAAPVVEFGNQHRTAGREPEIILLINGLGGRKEPARIKGLIAQKLVGVAMEFVATGFGDKADGAAGSMASLGFESAGLDAELGERLN